MLGELNSDLLEPDKQPKGGRVLMDLLDIYDFKNVIHTATRITKTSMTLPDLVLTNNARRARSSGVVHVLSELQPRGYGQERYNSEASNTSMAINFKMICIIYPSK